MIFTFIPKDKYKGVVNFSIIADQAVVYEGEASVRQPTLKSTWSIEVKQGVFLAVPTDIFIRIAQAKKVQFQIGPKSYLNSLKLNDWQKRYVAALAGTIK